MALTLDLLRQFHQGKAQRREEFSRRKNRLFMDDEL